MSLQNSVTDFPKGNHQAAEDDDEGKQSPVLHLQKS